jgi:F-type H+-transporting ATPase subunit alpha
LKLLYSQYRELQTFAQFGSDLDADTKARLEQGARIVEVLKQNRNSPIDVELQVCIIYAVVNNMLAEIPVDRIRDFETALFEYLTVQQASVLESIRDTRQLTAENEEALRQAILTCKSRFLG